MELRIVLIGLLMGLTELVPGISGGTIAFITGIYNRLLYNISRLSPAVFTNEIDQTFLTQGISQIGGAVVGPFSRGPAYAPTIVRTHAELEDLFGVPQGKYYQPFTAREYLTHQGVVTIVRVGALGGYKQA